MTTGKVIKSWWRKATSVKMSGVSLTTGEPFEVVSKREGSESLKRWCDEHAPQELHDAIRR